MSALDPTVAAVLDRAHPGASDDEDEDALIAALEEEADDDGHGRGHGHASSALHAFREQRLQQLHDELARAKAMRNSDHGALAEIKDEKQVMDITTREKMCVVHFMKPDFTRCRVMDQKLEALAPKHFDTRFLSLNVENAPFLVTKLKIQVLPCVLCFVDGVSTDRIVGFEGLSRKGDKPDEFSLRELEARLMRAGVLVRSKMLDEDEGKARRDERDEDEDSGDDWD